MSYPEQAPQEIVPQELAPQEPRVLPGYFSPAVAPPQFQQAPVQQAQQARPAPAGPMPYSPVQQPMQYAQPGALSQPLYPASFLEAVGRFYGKYATFNGRASRSEFWWVQLALAGLFIVAAMVSGVTGGDWVAGVCVMFMLASAVPYIALTIRRLHDANFSGGMGALWLVPYVGFLIVGILALMPSNPRGTRFEKAPLLSAPNAQQRF
ncbi:DUF805 domain-containing protein [Arthrobacter sp. TWP1-1]|uniref:DUF805 domain-containing protein n=1 Tax=Arthrobacter sp. TWP1-1 TaxID=2804568 RepID=UPI003CE6EE7E